MSDRKKYRLSPLSAILLAILLLVIADLEAADFAAQAECPVCKIKFATIEAHEATGTRALDGRPLNSRFLPPAECPMCSGVFGNEVLSRSELRHIESFIWSPEYQQKKDSDAWLRHALILEKLERPDNLIAQAYLRASWAADHNPETQKYYQKKSLELLQNFIAGNSYADSKDFLLYLTTGDLLRQLGSFNEAQAWFAKMLTEPQFKEGWQKLVINQAIQLVEHKVSKPVPFPVGNALHQAITTKDQRAFATAITNQALINEVNIDGLPAILMAIKEKQQQFIDILLKSGADPEQPDSSGNNAMHWAVITENHDLLRRLISQTSNIDPVNGQGQTPLFLAVRNNDPRLAVELLKAGARTNIRDSAGNNLLHILATGFDRGNPQVMTLLLERGIDLDQRNFADYTPLQTAAISGNKNLIRNLVEAGANINTRLPDGSNVLFFCRPDLIPFLLELGADANLKNNTGQTALVYASLNADNKRKQFFRKSDKYGSKSKQFSLGSTTISIFSAAEHGHYELVSQIIKQDPTQVNAKETNLGETPLHFATAGGHSGLVELLIRHGAIVNSESDFLRTPLHYAALAGNLETVRLLCEAGANIHALDARGSTPLHEAAAGRNIKVYNYLISLGASDSTVNNAGEAAKGILDQN